MRFVVLLKHQYTRKENRFVNLPPDSRIDKVLLKICDTEVDWGRSMDNVVKAFFLLLENMIKSPIRGNICDKYKIDLSFPCWMEIYNLLAFEFGSHARSGLVSKLRKRSQSVHDLSR